MLGIHSYGEELRSCEFGDIRVSETQMSAGLVLPEHAHASGQICFVLEGSYRERTREGDHWLHAGDIQFHAPGESHANTFSSENALTILISIDPCRWIDIATRRPLPRLSLLDDVCREVRAELKREDATSAVALEGLALLSMARLARLPPQFAAEPQFLLGAVARIQETYHRTISLSSIAGDVGVHRATLAAAFRRFRETSVGGFIRATRVRNAAVALTGGRGPLAEIAQQSGFSDQAHFSRVFKKLTGMTPDEYRRRSPKCVSARNV